jgi:hypothetical protein
LTAVSLLLNLHHSTSALLKYAYRNGSLLFKWISGGVSKSSGSNEYSHPIQGTFSYSVESGRFYISGTTIDLFLYELHLDTQTETGFPLKNIQGTFEYG